ncbi:MAG: PH domain-containing protein [Acutalibacteraceae bacterium]|jgi:putative membrane protein
MIRRFKAHPLMIFSFIKPFLFILLIPVARGIIQYVKNGQMSQILGLETLLFGAISFFGVLRWRSFSLVCDSKYVTVQTGVIFVKKAVIPISSLSSVQSEQNPIDYIFKSVTYRINTEAGSRRRIDYRFKLSRRDSHEVSALLYGKRSGDPVKFSSFKIAILAAATSSAFAGMLVGVPLLNNAARLFGLGINEVIDEITTVSEKFQSYFPPIVNTITLILLFGYVVSFLYSFFKYLNFRLFLDDTRIEVRSGLFVKLRTSFKKASVNNVKIEQTFLMILLRRFAMKVNVGGYGEDKSESQVLIPLGRYDEIKSQFSDYLPFFKLTGKSIEPPRGLVQENRFLLMSEIYLILTAAVSAVNANIFKEFGKFILFVTIIAACVILYYSYLCVCEYKDGKIRFSDTVFACSKRALRRYQLYCPKDRVGEIRLVRFPADKLYKTCNVKIIVRSETADSITLHHVDYKAVKDAIYKCYNLSE